MSSLKIGRSHKARKALFTRAIRRGWLMLDEIDDALPSGSLTDAERWLLFYSLRAARVEVRDNRGLPVDLQVHAGPKPSAETMSIEAELAAEDEAVAADQRRAASRDDADDEALHDA